MKEAQLKELPGSSRLALGFFNSLIRRIECTKPLAGNGVEISQQDDGISINISNSLFGQLQQGINVVTLNVCSNGTPATIQVYGPRALT